MKYLATLVLSIFIFNASFSQSKSNASNVEVPPDGVFTIVEQMPEFPGGTDAMYSFLATNILYPDYARKKGIEGKVFIQFIISEVGKVTEAKVIRGVDTVLDREALRVVNKMPNWESGKMDGKAVKVQYTLPISFGLN